MTNHCSAIAAISTPPGKGGVAIIRISGPDALKIASRVFFPKSKKNFEKTAPRIQVRGDIIYNGELIDDGMATYFKAPFSYTGEDTVEISCHGGMLVSSLVLESVFASGALPAEPGEFTKRAFINGKLSLIEAEAIGNLLEAESREQVKLASETSRAELASETEEIRKLLTSVLSSTYARIDYPDEDLGDFTDAEALLILSNALTKTKNLISTYRTGKAVSEGIKTTLCGKTNVGKSSIYNLLLGKDAAIVTDIEGTTRDVLTDKISLGRVMLRLSDTAGVRFGEELDLDPVEKIGIERTKEEMLKSELILAVFDSSRELDTQDCELIERLKECKGAKIAILNKCDLEKKLDFSSLSDFFDIILEISAKSGRKKASDELTEAVNKLFTDEKIKIGEDAVISTARQNAIFVRAHSYISSAISAYEAGLAADAASSDIELALGAISELDGRAVSEEIVADIFSKFCVGK